ncbi:MAG: nucleotidyl transferase AbiEii/AbiGii toxin family protein [Longimicrobiales bacterium]|nr:nucleotidyl transferase AbiEii/AbiGii toxin family protein [Longimicrobiales bacterium]
MTAPDLIGLFIEPLERTKIPYMITGGVASVIYGDPRFTRDIDIVLALRRPDVPRLAAEFQGGDFYVPPTEVLETEAARPQGGHFNIIHRDTALRADVYLVGDDPLHAWAFGRRRRMRFEAIEIWVAPLEYVIVRKLQYFEASKSDRHLRDIAMMLRISGEILDAEALQGWLAELHLNEAFGLARRYEPT